MPHLYLIHFDDALHHAKHYLGSSDDVLQRLAAHARGTAARLTEVLREQEMPWKVAAIWQITDPTITPRNLERKLKNRNNGPKLCPVCNPAARPPKGTIQIPILPLTDKDLRND